MSADREQVENLLAKYQRYKELVETEASLSHRVAKMKLAQTVDEDLLKVHNEAKQQVQSLSDSMTFANPIVWMMYKYEAYQNEPQAIRTLQDFRIHCSKTGYICTKRFTFLNDWLLALAEPSLLDTTVYDGMMRLDEIYASPTFERLCVDPEFINQWSEYEFHRINGRPAKWENYAG